MSVTPRQVRACHHHTLNMDKPCAAGLVLYPGAMPAICPSAVALAFGWSCVLTNVGTPTLRQPENGCHVFSALIADKNVNS